MKCSNTGYYRFHIYVGNRIGEILELSDAHQWRYVPTAQNPADDVSRGIAAAEFSTNHRFYKGPSFLYNPPESWPSFPDLKNGINEAEDPEIRCTRWVGATLRVHDAIDELTINTSRYPFLIGVVEFVKRFVSNARKDKSHRNFEKINRDCPCRIRIIPARPGFRFPRRLRKFKERERIRGEF